MKNLVDVSIFYIFFLLGSPKGESDAPGGGEIGFFLKVPGGEWGGPSRTGWGQGAGKVSAVN